MFHRHDGGKGDKPILPQDKEKFDNNWDAIFKKKQVAEECVSDTTTKRVQYPCEVIRPTDNK